MPRSGGGEEAEDADPAPARFVRVGLAFAGLVLVGLGAGATGVLVPYQLADYRISKVLLGLLFFAFSGGDVVSGLANGALIRLLGPLLAAEIVDHRHLPWQDTYLVLGAVSAPLLIGFAVALPRRVPTADPVGSGAMLRPALRRPEVWLTTTFLILYVGVEVTVG